MKKYLFIALCFLSFSCTNKPNKESPEINQNNLSSSSVRAFINVDKDSSYWVRYDFKRADSIKNFSSYNYQNKDELFSVLYDYTAGQYYLIVNKKDTSLFLQEAERYYTINEKNYKVVKLLLNKYVADGETTYFFNKEFGLLLIKSNTWRISKILDTDNPNLELLQLKTLLFNLLTDEDFFKNKIPISKIKYKHPKIEE